MSLGKVSRTFAAIRRVTRSSDAGLFICLVEELGITTMAALEVEAVPHPELISLETTSKTSFNIGTRKSALALVQTELVVEALKNAWPDHEFQIHARDTAAGDIDKVTPFKDIPVKNLWTHELEQLLIENKLDLLVHSLKGKPVT
jgi:Porphobilinogen deaminase, dipyromethane cofactor binding domain